METDTYCLVGKDCWGNPEPHHLKTRGAGGSDDYENIMPLCRKHHTEIHSSGKNRFVEKYRLQSWMRERGWVFEFFNGKWFNPRLG